MVVHPRGATSHRKAFGFFPLPALISDKPQSYVMAPQPPPYIKPLFIHEKLFFHPLKCIPKLADTFAPLCKHVSLPNLTAAAKACHLNIHVEPRWNGD